MDQARGSINMESKLLRLSQKIVALMVELQGTVEPRYYGHQGDRPNCPY